MATLLYVDDEQWVMSGVIELLKLQFEVLTARNADQALEVFYENRDIIDAIVLDIMMPLGTLIIDGESGRTTGLALAQRLLVDEHVVTPILFYTVVTDPVIHQKLRDIGVREIILKTKKASELVESVRRALSDVNAKSS